MTMSQSVKDKKAVEGAMKRSVVLLGVLGLIMWGCASVGGARFPTPSAGFEPTHTYGSSYEDTWNAVKQALQSERISIASSDKDEGSIVTDYVQGETQMVAAGLLGVITTRYKYSVSLEKDGDSKTTVNIVCKLESSSENIGWHDVSKDNGELVAKLENWLYEKIAAAS